MRAWLIQQGGENDGKWPRDISDIWRNSRNGCARRRAGGCTEQRSAGRCYRCSTTVGGHDRSVAAAEFQSPGHGDKTRGASRSYCHRAVCVPSRTSRTHDANCRAGSCRKWQRQHSGWRGARPSSNRRDFSAALGGVGIVGHPGCSDTVTAAAGQHRPGTATRQHQWPDPFDLPPWQLGAHLVLAVAGRTHRTFRGRSIHRLEPAGQGQALRRPGPNGFCWAGSRFRGRAASCSARASTRWWGSSSGPARAAPGPRPPARPACAPARPGPAGSNA
jgi:hypothetical protein